MRRTPEMIARLRTLAGQGLYAKAISRELGVHHKTVAAWAKAEGIDLPAGCKPQGWHPGNTVMNPERQAMARKLAATHTIMQASANLLVNSETLRHWAQRSGVVFVAQETGRDVAVVRDENMRRARATRWAWQARMTPKERDLYRAAMGNGYKMAEALTLVGRADLLAEARP